MARTEAITAVAIKRLSTFTCHFMDTGTRTTYATLDEAKDAAAEVCGNRSFARPFPKEQTYLCGAGDGTTSVIIRQDIEFTDDSVAP